ncbi:MAG: branched-chain amino acid ABC transporter permease [Ardenticatenia bacterium]|nr:branched-chain amino acid ABC transporter permease [Ardenticatenia bacterium]
MIQDAALSQSRPDGISERLDRAAGPWAVPNKWFLIVLVVVALALPWGIIQLSIGRFILHLVILFFAWGIVTQSWNLILGVGGIFSFAQVALFAVGGYTSGILSQQFGWSPFFTIWLAPVGATIAALIIGLPVLRLRGPYVVLLTLAFHELLRNFGTQGPKWIAGGGYGLRYVPKFGFEDMWGPTMGRVAYYYVGLLFFGITSYVIWRIFHSPIGMSFRAMRDSETYAISRGVDPFRFKLLLFALSAFFTGLAGGYLVHYNGAQSPAILNFGILINLLAMIVLGGWGTFWGPIMGTAVLTALPEVMRAVDLYRNLSMGLVLVLVAMFAPEGLGPLIAKWVTNLSRALPRRQEE